MKRARVRRHENPVWPGRHFWLVSVQGERVGPYYDGGYMKPFPTHAAALAYALAAVGLAPKDQP